MIHQTTNRSMTLEETRQRRGFVEHPEERCERHRTGERLAGVDDRRGDHLPQRQDHARVGDDGEHLPVCHRRRAGVRNDRRAGRTARTPAAGRWRRRSRRRRAPRIRSRSPAAYRLSSSVWPKATPCAPTDRAGQTADSGLEHDRRGRRRDEKRGQERPPASAATSRRAEGGARSERIPRIRAGERLRVGKERNGQLGPRYDCHEFD